MVLFKTLNQESEQFNIDRINRLSLLYRGGYDISASAQTLLPKLAIESDRSYKERLVCTSYIPYLSQFVDHFSSSLFSSEMSVLESADATNSNTLGSTVADEGFYKLFASDCDQSGNSLHNFVKDAFTEALHLPRAYIGLDFQQATQTPANLLEEETLGLSRAYAYYIDPLSVIDWRKSDANSKFDWVKLRNEIIIHDDPLAAPLKQLEFTLWTMQGGQAAWKKFRTQPVPLNKPYARDRDDIAPAESGLSSFREIPIFALQLPPGLALGEKLGPICEEYFQRRSFLINNENKACIAVPVVKLGPEVAAVDGAISDAQSDPGRGDNLAWKLQNKGFLVLGQNDDLEIKESTGSAHALVDKQLEKLVEQMHQIVHQMANSASQVSSSLGRSAASKAQDRHATEILLTAYARCVKDFVREIYSCISAARGEHVAWAVGGLCTYVEEDRDALLKEAMMLPSLDIPSQTFRKKYGLKVALSLLGSYSPDEERTIQEEIESEVDTRAHVQSLEASILDEQADA